MFDTRPCCILKNINMKYVVYDRKRVDKKKPITISRHFLGQAGLNFPFNVITSNVKGILFSFNIACRIKSESKITRKNVVGKKYRQIAIFVLI